jgi:DNA-directed RNA polymerase subunit RPC12/RpoP
MPIGSRRAPVPIGWQDAYNHETDSIDKDAYPQCPYCGEMPHSYEQCQFCGQRFLEVPDA